VIRRPTAAKLKRTRGRKTKGGTKGIYFIFHRNIHILGIPRHGATEPYCNPQKPKPYSPRPTKASPYNTES